MSDTNQNQLQKFSSKTSVLKYAYANLQSKSSNGESSMQTKLSSKWKFQLQSIYVLMQLSQVVWNNKKDHRDIYVLFPLC